MSDLTCEVDVTDALAPIGHAKERSYVEKRSEGSRGKKSHVAPTIRTPQGISQPRQSQSKQNDVAPTRQMVPARQVQEALEKFPPLPMLISQLYHILLKEPILPRRIIDSPPSESGSFKTCEHHFGSPRHSLKECKSLRGMIQGLIDNNIIQFENATITDSSPTSCEGHVNVLIKNKGLRGSFITGLPTAPYPHGVPYPSSVTKQRQSREQHSPIKWHNCLEPFVSLVIPAIANTIKGKVGRIDGI